VFGSFKYDILIHVTYMFHFFAGHLVVCSPGFLRLA
jgi:hypothetical protein